MDSLGATLSEYADTNYQGAAFLFAYGITWMVCALLWRTLKPQQATIATLFQGMVALPAAIGVSAGLGIFDERPGTELIAALGVLISMSQLLVLPLLIVLAVKGRLTLIPLLFSLAGAIHFVPFAWLYQSPLYIVMPLIIAIGLAVLYAIDRAPDEHEVISTTCAGRVCALTGASLLVTGVCAVAMTS